MFFAFAEPGRHGLHVTHPACELSVWRACSIPTDFGGGSFYLNISVKNDIQLVFSFTSIHINDDLNRIKAFSLVVCNTLKYEVRYCRQVSTYPSCAWPSELITSHIPWWFCWEWKPGSRVCYARELIKFSLLEESLYTVVCLSCISTTQVRAKKAIVYSIFQTDAEG